MTHLETNETLQKMIHEINSHNDLTRILIKVYTTENSPSATFFSAEVAHVIALFESKLRIEVTYLTPDCVIHKDLNVSSERLFESEENFALYLKESDIHVFLSHPHQGLEVMEWDMHRLYESFHEHLKDHVGFPSGDQLRDPVFEQNKGRYLSAMPPQMVLPFHIVPIPKVEIDEETTAVSISADDDGKLMEFLGVLQSEWDEFVVKTPYTTHGSAYSTEIYCSDASEVRDRIDKIIRLSNHLNLQKKLHRIPYCIVQPRLHKKNKNDLIGTGNNEYKILVLNGIAVGRVMERGSGRAFGSSWEEISKFSESVVDNLVANDPCAIGYDFMYRVDIFELNGELKLNELESFDAMVDFGGDIKKYVSSFESSKGRTRPLVKWSCDHTNEWYSKFWFIKLLTLLLECVRKRRTA